ncbi:MULTISPECIES: hypothetical protein [Colwellia]|uniref:YCII-related domain-containing protein n=1 Tax=Colwellia psychrerythraea (strain 34H / ATCC BAA-681) TaxID=167879 RepID=Q484V6_COLP3|nr:MULTISPECIES: hypothetical protein [Colwellia]AAZ27386.1 hypothetical protein CPS_1671 [Colwellia psychrerythraea 34H]PKH89054.1 hypothetical protein CXF79_02030 [Colwellia sp. Bg11-28]
MKKLLLTYSLVLLSLFSMTSIHASEADMRNTYAVTWTIETNDTRLFQHTINEQMTKMLKLWGEGILENVYLDNKKDEVSVHKGDVGKVMFFIKAKTEEEAKSVLDTMPLVKNNVASYQLRLAGVLWLKQY